MLRELGGYCGPPSSPHHYEPTCALPWAYLADITHRDLFDLFSNTTSSLVSLQTLSLSAALHCPPPPGCRQATPLPALLSVLSLITLPASVSCQPGTLLKTENGDMIVRKVRTQRRPPCCAGKTMKGLKTGSHFHLLWSNKSGFLLNTCGSATRAAKRCFPVC